ncbi:MAG: hypothetical protein AAGG51_30385, partial [Cyanobacteria bacterium P01_G01_bin.54]
SSPPTPPAEGEIAPSDSSNTGASIVDSIEFYEFSCFWLNRNLDFLAEGWGILAKVVMFPLVACP